MSITPNMGLTKWDLLADDYDHNQLSGNFLKIDIHDHATGNGVQIKRGGIAPYDAGNPTTTGIANNQLAPDAVTTDKILDGTIVAADINAAVLNSLAPLGTVVPWYRSSGAIPIPTTWAVCDGTAWASITNTMGVAGASLSAGTIPDLRNSFILGAATSGTGSGPTTPPALGATGGANTVSVEHTHTVNSHTHTVASHTHTVNSHAHNVSDHAHGIGTDGDHNHTYIGGFIPHSRQNAFLQGITVTDTGSVDRNNSLQSLYLAGFNPGGTDAAVPVDNAGAHSHGTATSGVTAGVATDAQSPGTSAASLTTDATAPGTNTPGTLGTVDIRPKFVGLLFIMKVTN